MRRREFIAFLGSAAVVWPLKARAQQAERVRRVAWIATTSPLSELVGVGATPQHPLARAFLQGMRELGYVEGRNLVLEWRSAEGKWEDLPEIIRQLIAINVDVIVAPTIPVTRAAKSVTNTVPIVMAGISLPVEYGFVQSLARPGGNITGLSFDVTLETIGKSLELIRELLPHATVLAWLGAIQSAEGLPSAKQFREVTSRKLGFNLLVPENTPQDYAGAFAQITRGSADAVFVAASAANFANRHLIVDFATRSRLPSIFATREFVDAGGLISYGVNVADLNRRAAG